MALAYTGDENTNDIVIQPASYSDNFVTAKYVPNPIRFYDPPSWVLSSCVETAKYILGKQGEKWGNAADIEPMPGLEPEVGLVIIFDNHIAVIIKLNSETMIIDEGNWEPGQRTQREIRFDDPEIKGYRRY